MIADQVNEAYQKNELLHNISPGRSDVIEFNFAAMHSETPDFNFKEMRASITDRFRLKKGFHLSLDSEMININQ